jgi:hypothetical protein
MRNKIDVNAVAPEALERARSAAGSASGALVEIKRWSSDRKRSVPGRLPETCPSTWFSASSGTPRCRSRPFMCVPNDNGSSMRRRNTIQKTAVSRRR